MKGKHRKVLEENPELKHERPDQWELLHELDRLGIENEPEPEVCDECGTPLEVAPGMVGESVAYCPNGHGIKWEDQEGAIARVL